MEKVERAKSVTQTVSSAVSQAAGLPARSDTPVRVVYALRSSGAREFTNSKRSGVHSRGYLPHVKREGASYFVTFRLADSLPREVLLQYKKEWASELQSEPGNATEAAKALQRKIERYLDRSVGACFLNDPKIAVIARDALLHFAGTRYVLDEWVIMPNHVHLVIRPLGAETLSSILRSRKTFIAREANVMLGRVGQAFWQPESYDHWIRDDDEKARIRRYVRNNPVKAGLSKTAEEWVWGSAFVGRSVGI